MWIILLESSLEISFVNIRVESWESRLNPI